MELYSPIAEIKGVGDKTEESLNKCLIFTVMDLLLYFPRDYQFVSCVQDVNNTNLKDNVTIVCKVIRINRDVKTKTGKILSSILVENDFDNVEIKWFNSPYVKNYFKVGEQYVLSGKISEFKGKKTLINPKIQNGKVEEKDIKDSIIPIYRLKSGLRNSTIIKVMSAILDEVKIKDNLPKYIIEKYNFCTLKEALKYIHAPKNKDELYIGIKRLKFQELFNYSLKILSLREYFEKETLGIEFSISNELVKLKESLPYKLTSAQSRVVKEILIDQKRSKATNRLIQGDVGSGKTVVALISIFNVIKNGYQAALMAPTEILATQHYEEAIKLYKDFNINIELLVGSVSEKRKVEIKKNLKEGLIDLIIGTHAILVDDVEFQNLGIVVTDEQHRFGVMQRAILNNKGKKVETLVMTATPIPRTLALYIYGDLDVSIIDELPPGRKKIDTIALNKQNRNKIYEFSLVQIREGRQVYIVCPLIEENEKLELNSLEELYMELKNNYYKDIDIAMIHGKIPQKEKDRIMNEFKIGKIKAIIATTVIEVGINVPNATIMIIENAERFGLSQLHQLRGRVGRGKHKSYCALICYSNSKITKKRMEVMCSSNDGFKIAEEDLKLRGSGDLFGTRQHGEDGFLLADIIADVELLKESNREAKKLLLSKNSEDAKLKEEIIKTLKETSRFISFN